MQFCFVSTRRGSHFMTELLAAIADATAACGHAAELVLDEFPKRDGECVYVVIPHEFDAWGDRAGFPDALQRARTIALCTENPGTEWFEATYRLVPQFGAAVSINRSSAAELRRRGIRCEHIQLGYVPSWDAWHRDETAARDIDVLYLGAADPRRDPLLAGLGEDLACRECQLLVPPLEPRTGPRPDFLTGTEKYRRLRSARVLLNLHRTTSAALEWMRFIEAICNGCLVVSEPCLDADPLIPGRHFVEASADRIGQVIDGLLDDPDRLRQMRDRAYDFVHDALPTQSAAVRMAELAAELPRHSSAPRTPKAEAEPWVGVDLVARTGSSVDSSEPAKADAELRAPLGRSGPEDAQRESRAIRRARSLKLAFERRVFRGMDRPDVRNAHHRRSIPRVSVVSVVMAGSEPLAVEALTSIAGSQDCGLEILTIGGGASQPWLERFALDHPALPFAFFRQPAIDAIGPSLNRLIGYARGDYVFVLESTGGVFPTTLSRLAIALDRDPAAYFSYSMVAVFDGGRPVELRSSLPWEPERLKRGDWIDAMALIRRDRLLELDSFATDPRLVGWEAFDFWCKCAEVGGYGLHIPQVLAWHRRSLNATSVEHDIATTAPWTAMRERHPRIFSDESANPRERFSPQSSGSRPF
jgi:hypothetical protein